MKTKQEQIEEMAHIMCEYYNRGFCANGDMTEICEDMPDCCYKNYAEALYEAGYGDVSEYKAEIERLRQEVRDTDKMARNSIEQYKNNYDNAFERLKEQEREIERLKAEFKQLETNAEILARGVRDLNHENYELTEKIKQAQIDVLKKLRSMVSDKEALIQSYIADGCLTIEDMYTDIDILIEEVENDK